MIEPNPRRTGGTDCPAQQQRDDGHGRRRRRGVRRRPTDGRPRGQTTQDFAVGIAIFLLTIAFVFTYVPTLTTPYEGSIGGAETAQADRIADRIVANASTSTPNELDGSEYQSTFAQDPDDLVEALALRANEDTTFDRVNITIQEVGDAEIDESEWTGGHSYDGQTAASSARIVTIDNEDCDPGCRLVVRVW